MVSLAVPDNYGYVVLGNIVVPFFTNFFLGGIVRALACLVACVDNSCSHALRRLTPAHLTNTKRHVLSYLIIIDSQVMKARKDYDVPYPNLYATPGFHKQADVFNRVQRGHQAIFEHLVGVTAMGLIGGLKHPIVSALSGVFYCAGSYFYLVGYADTKLDVATARYKKGGVLKIIGT